ncbi:MAG: hypothetical protein OER97_03355 [Gammaproteobacteria bacterium]|nr:hypothetical protein [Gammaproteobacteria bacterium]
MSSATYSASIQPNLRLRYLVLGSGMLLAAIGALVILLLPLVAHWRAVLLAAWLVMVVTELLLSWRAYRESLSYRLYCDGSIDVMRPTRGPRAAAFAAGSVIGTRLAWLRVRAADGACWGELIAGNPRKNKEWRRFQVICRLVGAC